jgi:Type I phosphodiesterase / nucleotide pyrophosphatase
MRLTRLHPSRPIRTLWNALAIGAVVITLLSIPACTLLSHNLATGGEVPLKTIAPAEIPETHVLVFAMDGAGYDNFMTVIRTGHAPNISGILGHELTNGVFEHGYSSPDALSILPSSTVADWCAIFSGAPPAVNGITGDEYFVRDPPQFFAPVPVSVSATTDLQKAVVDGLIGKSMKVATLFQQLNVDSNVSLLWIYRGATIYTTVGLSSYASMVGDLIAGKLNGDSAAKSVSGVLDFDSVQKLIAAIEQHGVPNLQVVYFPGIDIFTHAAPNPLASQRNYLSEVTDKAVGEVLDEYRKNDALDDTYVMFISDHGHTPTLDDDRHKLGAGAGDTPFGVVAKAGFRVRKDELSLPDGDRDYQAVLAYQGFMAYVYLADRSTCRASGTRCDWGKPPRFKQDVMPVVRAFDRVNRTGRPFARLKGTIDLIFTRVPSPPGKPQAPFEIFDGHRLVPIADYLHDHPRPDLLDLEQRMNWLSVGPYGDRAGDIVLLAKSGEVPINQRYYFAADSHYSWHGSADALDSRVPLMLIQVDGSGERMRKIVRGTVRQPPSEMDLSPIVRSLFHRHEDDD